MRLDKFLVNMGHGSRKEVKELIKKKRVTVNDQIAVKREMHIDPNVDQVKLDDTVISYQEFIYIMLHKPAGYLSATEDDKQKTVLDLIKQQDKVLEPFPVGRLDKDTEGLLLLTNDGQLAHELLSPKKHVDKRYLAEVEKHVSESDVERFKEGVTLDDGYVTKPAKLKIIDDKIVEITITEGKFHQIKRMFEAVNNKVTYLKRLSMGTLLLDEQLKLGDYRELTEQEWKSLQDK
ncbi:pseudouridine synthase [Gracilibacillus sp. S3-1-1]|uniref:Pseudouridine synthase n=1 Tax=Gracilibacillus pellucidus TaxID=3095368 RepID=A0ACC6M9C9_9BACI|nr:pseudouridine synthase [Gracilibacillus sp. S3-1-1]MDX8047467.1 pseudouridine synthase [Gracilibacillus sp. S3-1-1]